MPRLTRLHSFLDRFEQRLEVDCEQLKHQLLAQVDQQFGVLRTKVRELRSRFSGNRVFTTLCISLENYPPVETVQLDQWKQTQGAMMLESSGNARDVASTSTGRTRKSTSTSAIANKRQRTVTTTDDGSSKYLCKSAGCGKSFRLVVDLKRHERIHLGVKPFACTWPDCCYSSMRKDNIVRHVRIKHFKLPLLHKEQERLNIVDNRDPEDYVRVDNQLLERRLD